jgi:hypothetical protein
MIAETAVFGAAQSSFRLKTPLFGPIFSIKRAITVTAVPYRAIATAVTCVNRICAEIG